MVVERLVVGGDDPRDVPGRLASALAVVELRVVRRRRVLQGRIQRRGSAREPGSAPCRQGSDARSVPDSAGSWSTARAAARSTRAPTVGSRSAEASLVTCFGVSRSKVERYSHWSSNGSSVARSRKTVVPSLAGLALQRGRDQVAGPLTGQHVLGGEQPVVAAQVHPATDRDRLAHQRRPELARGRCRHGIGEEDPHVRADPGAGHLQRGGRSDGSRRLQVGERVQHGGLSVEVRGEPAGLVAGEHRIQADVDVAGQMRGQHLGRQRQVSYVGGSSSLAPPALDRGHPARLTGAGVLPAHGVDVASRAEQRGIELDLGLARTNARPPDPAPCRTMPSGCREPEQPPHQSA